MSGSASHNQHCYDTHVYTPDLRLEVLLSGGGLSADTLAEVDALAMFLMAKGEKVMGKKWWRHNTHSLLELVRASLVATMDAGRGATGEFERCHSWGKRGGRGLPTVVAENYAFDRWVAKDAMMLALRGLSWGSRAQFRLGSGFFTLADTREGKTHLSHPVIRHLMGGESVLAQYVSRGPESARVRVVEADGWEPMSPQELRTQRVRETDELHAARVEYEEKKGVYKPTLNTKELERLQEAVTDCGSSKDASHTGRAARIINLKYGVQRVQPNGKVETVKCGDNVELCIKGVPAYATVERIIAVVNGGRCSVWVFPLWYYKKKAGLHELVDKTRNTTLVTRLVALETYGPDTFMPVPVRTLRQRVHTQHHCEVLTDKDQKAPEGGPSWKAGWAETQRRAMWFATTTKDNQLYRTKCAVRRTCNQHADHMCKDDACVADFQRWVHRMCHCTAGPGLLDTYEVFTQSQGFRPRRKAIGYDHGDDDDDDGADDDDDVNGEYNDIMNDLS
jgi:hypothetical protein